MTLRVDSSQLQTFKDCPLKYRLQYVEGYVPIERAEAEHDRDFGRAVHDGLAAWYRGQGLEAALEAFQKAYGTHLDETDLAKTPFTGQELIRRYVDWAQARDAAFEILSVEEVDSFEPVPGIEYLVKIDLVVRRRDTGEVYGLDHKVTGSSVRAPDFWARFEPNDALTAYTAYLASKYGQCSGMYVNALAVGYRKRAYKGEPAGFHAEFERQIFNRSIEQVSAWKERLPYWLARIEEAKEKGLWPTNTSQCRFCSYRTICIAEWSPDDPEERAMIEIQYERVDPLQYLEGSRQ